MHIDDSLAKGLANAFFRELHKQHDRGSNRRTNIIYSETKKGPRAWKRTIQRILASDQYFILASYVGGTKSNVFFANATLFEGEHSEEDWNERALLISYYYDSPNLKYDADSSGYKDVGDVSHHVIKRLYKRLPSDRFVPGEIYGDHIINELSYLPVWIDFWMNFISWASSQGKSSKHYSLKPCVPAPSGMIFCTLHAKSPILSARTFMETERISPDEARLRGDLIAVSEDSLGSVLPFEFFISAKDPSRNVRAEFLLLCDKLNPIAKDLIYAIVPSSATEIEKYEALEFFRKFLEYNSLPPNLLKKIKLVRKQVKNHQKFELISGKMLNDEA